MEIPPLNFHLHWGIPQLLFFRWTESFDLNYKLQGWEILLEIQWNKFILHRQAAHVRWTRSSHLKFPRAITQRRALCNSFQWLDVPHKRERFVLIDLLMEPCSARLKDESKALIGRMGFFISLFVSRLTDMSSIRPKRRSPALINKFATEFPQRKV